MGNTKLLEKKNFIDQCIRNGVLLNKEFLDSIDDFSAVNPLDLARKDMAVIARYNTKDLAELSPQEIERKTVYIEKKRQISALEIASPGSDPGPKDPLAEHMHGVRGNALLGTIKVVHSYSEKAKKREVQDFVGYFNARYRSIEKLLRNRQELGAVTSISRVLTKKDKETVSVIGMVKEINLTKNGNMSMTIEDPSGEINIIVNKTKPRLFSFACNITPDEILGVTGANSNKVIFANNIIHPDIPNKEMKKCNDETYALFLSDLHVGSNHFLEEKFERFLKWINQESGNDEQRNIAAKTKYIFFLGDIVDGVGVYPNQELDQNIKDVNAQYEKCFELFSKIPSHINLIICPGNHDALRIEEPQPPFYPDFSGRFLQIPNATYVSNPSFVNIHSSENFSGFDVLIYHGYSFDYYIANIDQIRTSGGYDRADLVMKYLLERRHLAPTHTSTLYIPDSEKDILVIEQVPDFFVTGHLHKTSVSQYKATTLISGSCWQDITNYQIKVGHHPEPGRVPVVNLKTREMRILRF